MKNKVSKMLLGLLVSTAGAVFGQKAEISANIKGLGNGEITIYYREGDSTITSAIKATDGKFTWSAPMSQPQKLSIMYPNRLMPYYVEAGKMKLTGNIDSLDAIRLSGSKFQDEADAFFKTIDPLTQKEYATYTKALAAKDREKLALEKERREYMSQKDALKTRYIAKHPDSYLSLTLLTDMASVGHYEDLQPSYALLADRIKNTVEGKRLAERMDVLKRSSIGTSILEFTQVDVDGQPVHFADFKGKYVFVDFWASWCKPCRAENPNVLRAYNKYKDMGFTVIGISLDTKGEAWKKAIKEDGMPWTQVSDLKGWENEVSNYYGIHGIPSTLLVDPQGKIIAKDLKGETLIVKLGEILNK